MIAQGSLVSVVVPIHNASSYLDRTLEHLCALDRRIDYEFILIDDHSTDDSLSRINTWHSSLPGAVKVLNAERRGVAHARNQAIAHASGEFVWLTDADDTWAATIVADLYDRAVVTGAEVVVCNAIKRSPAGQDLGAITDAASAETFSGREAFVRLLDGRLQGHLWNKLFRRRLLLDNPFPPTRAHSDLGGMLRALPAAGTVAGIPVAPYVYIQNPGSILNSDEYDSADLEACLETAFEESNRLGLDRREMSAFTEFKYRNIVVPIVNEYARRATGLRRRTQLSRASRGRQLIRWAELTVLLGRRCFRVFAQAVVVKLSLGLYFFVFSLRRTTVRATTAR